jgi:hypothetical protein
MTIVSKSAPTAAVSSRLRYVLGGVAVVLVAFALYRLWGYFRGPSIPDLTAADRPMLKSDGPEFRDTQVGLRFTAPKRWSMQARTTEAPQAHERDRVLVKYKRILPDLPAAWFRVYVVDTPADQSIEQCLAERNPGNDWKTKGEVEKLTVAGQPAARILYGGIYERFPSLREMVGVRRGGQVFYFVSTYRVGDRNAEETTRQLLTTVLFES